MLPAAAYTSPDVLAWEQRHFFAASWVCLGRDEAVLAGRRDAARPRRSGTSPCCSRGTRRVVLSAFANTCRHRGHELLPDGGTSAKRAVVCPYHAWTLRPDGVADRGAGLR